METIIYRNIWEFYHNLSNNISLKAYPSGIVYTSGKEYKNIKKRSNVIFLLVEEAEIKKEVDNSLFLLLGNEFTNINTLWDKYQFAEMIYYGNSIFYISITRN